MNPFIQRWLRPVLLIFALLWLGPANRAHAAVSCSASMSNLSFGTVDVVSNIGLKATASLTYTCTNKPATAQTVTACFSIGDPNGAFYSNRWINKGTNKLYFQFYQDLANSQIWGTIFGGSITPPKITISIPASGTTGPVMLPVYGTVKSSQAGVSNGTYSTSYGTGDTLMTFSTGLDTTCQGTSAGGFPFTVSATTPKSCVVMAGAELNLDAVSLIGSNTIGVTCSNNTPYFVGLSPSNSNTAGAGIMSGTGGNTDKVPYQLRSVSATGPVWGNTATTTAVGNGVAGTGTGASQSIPVFATTPNANFTPDSYADTVTVNVNY